MIRHSARPNNPKFVIEVLKNILPTINKAIAITAPGIAYPATDRLIKILFFLAALRASMTPIKAVSRDTTMPRVMELPKRLNTDSKFPRKLQRTSCKKGNAKVKTNKIKQRPKTRRLFVLFSFNGWCELLPEEMAIFFCVAPSKLPIAKISRANKKSNNDNFVDEFKSP